MRQKEDELFVRERFAEARKHSNEQIGALNAWMQEQSNVQMINNFSIKKRVLAYSQDIKHANEYDHVITNDNVENCFNKILKIIKDHLNN